MSPALNYRNVTSPRKHTANHPQRCSAEISSRLAACGYSRLDNIQCEYRDGEVILSGIVPTYYLKQIAQAAICKLDIVKRVINQLEVHSCDDRTPLGRPNLTLHGET